MLSTAGQSKIKQMALTMVHNGKHLQWHYLKIINVELQRVLKHHGPVKSAADNSQD